MTDKDYFELIRRINEITLEIDLHYPELYKALDETPVKLRDSDAGALNLQALCDYLINLKSVLNHYKETHKPV